MQDIVRSETTVSSTDQPLADLIGKLSTDLQSLFQHEVTLAKQELAKKVDHVEASVTTLSIGLMLLLGGLLALLAAAILGLAVAVPAWAAALVVGVALFGIGAALSYTGKQQLFRLNLRPNKVMKNLQRDVAAVKEAAT